MIGRIRLALARLARDDSALASSMSLVVIYFAIGAGFLFAQEAFCAQETAFNLTSSGCGVSISGLTSSNLSSVQKGATSSVPGANLSAQAGVGDPGVGFGLLSVLQLAWTGISRVVAVVAWPSQILGAIGFPPVVYVPIQMILMLLITVAILAWIRGVQ